MNQLTETLNDTCSEPGCCDDAPVSIETIPPKVKNNAVSEDHIREQVRQHYGGIVENKEDSECAPGCCGDTKIEYKPEYTRKLGYSDEDMAVVPEASNYGLGCGNPILVAKAQPGEVVVDLGSGAGIDCFLSSKHVGDTGRVIGVDMTPIMISKARENAESNNFTNVEFRLGEIENLPIADQSVDVIISNCVVNLSPNKNRVFEECFRVLKPGGRIAISDIIATAPLSEKLKEDMALYCGCMSGAMPLEELKSALSNSGFTNIEVKPKDNSREIITEWVPNLGIEDVLCSAYILAIKP